MYTILLAVPTLKRLAWTKTVQILQQSGNLNKEILKKLGIPKVFLQYVDDEFSSKMKAA